MPIGNLEILKGVRNRIKTIVSRLEELNFPLIVFLLVWFILLSASFRVVLDFSEYGTFYDFLISFLVFFSVLVGGLTVIWFYKLKNYSPLLRWMVGFSTISFFLGFFSLKWIFLFPLCLFSTYIIFKSKKKDLENVRTSKKLTKYLFIISTASILIHPIVSLATGQQKITIQPGDGNITTRFYLENWSKNSNLSETVLESLSENQAEVILGLTSKGSKGYQGGFRISNKTETIIDRFKAAGVKLNAWLLISDEMGFWSNNYNYRVYKETYNDLKNWDRDMSLGMVQLDSESTFGNRHSTVYENLLVNVAKYFGDFVHNYNSDSISEARISYGSLVSNINGKYQSSVAAYPFVLEDTMDGDTSLQSILGVSTYPPKNWDEVVPMVYRSTFSRKLNSGFGSYLVYSYSYSWRELLGNKTSIALARPGYREYEEIKSLARDVRLLDALGFEESNIYCLNNLLGHYGTDKLDDFFKEVKKQEEIEISYNPLVSYVRTFMALFDRLI